MLSTLFKCFILLAYLGAAASAAAHTFFFGITDININENNQHIEIIHQFTAHDIENAIAETQQIHFSVEDVNFEKRIKQLFNKHFSIENNQELIPLNWIGVELVRGKIFVYQEGPAKNFLSGLVVKNSLLVDTYPEQINTVNYQDNDIKGSLTFTQSQQIVTIEHNN